MTSNIGVRDLKDFGQGVGFATKTRVEDADDITINVLNKALKKTFAPEFLNRIDDVVVFNSLDKDNIAQIVEIILQSLYKRINELGYKIELSEDVKLFVAEKGYDPQYGARPLHRAIQKYLEDPLAEEILSQSAQTGDTLMIEMNEDKTKITVTVLKTAEPKVKE